MNALMEALVGIVLFIIIIAFTTSRVQDIFLANTQEALYESLSQRGHAISSFIKLWLETRAKSIEEIRSMSEEDFRRIFIYKVSQQVYEKLKSENHPMKDLAYYVKITAIAEVSGSFTSSRVSEPYPPPPPIEMGIREIPNHAVKIIDMAKVQNTLWLIEAYLWVG
ncbi:hypothetical protein KEJ17_01455 [Candidatus Bathyarchaeota archaeon]|nr:hypothetical protein [Candidatus Bathyarchaeota archaeon]